MSWLVLEKKVHFCIMAKSSMESFSYYVIIGEMRRGSEKLKNCDYDNIRFKPLRIISIKKIGEGARNFPQLHPYFLLKYTYKQK